MYARAFTHSVIVLPAVLLAGVRYCSAAPPDELVCPRVAGAPTLDGRLLDPCWDRAVEVTGFTRPLSAAPPVKGIAAKLCFDAEALYLGLTCTEPHPDKIKASAPDGSPDVWQDDCVEIWLRTGMSQTEFDQFIVNAAGSRQAVCIRSGRMQRDWQPAWHAAAHIADDRWSAEIAIPFAALNIPAPRRGAMLQFKLGREDYAGGRQDLATWPPGSRYAGAEGYGKLYFESDNVLVNPDMSRVYNGAMAGWGFGKEDGQLFAPAQDDGQGVILFRAPGRYSVAQQNVQLRPNSVGRLEARVKGTAGVYLRARTAERKDGTTIPHTVNTNPSNGYVPYQLRFPTGETGRALIIIGNTESHGTGEVLIAGLRVSQDVAYEADGPAIPVTPGEPVVIRKLLVTDCRALRGFVVAPVDGRLDSLNWNMDKWEYGMRGAGAGVGYRYRDNDGLHITLSDAEGVDAVQVRGGARVKLYRNAEHYDAPGRAPLLWQFEGRARTCRALLSERAKGNRFSLFELEDGLVADVSFFRVNRRESSSEPRPEFALVAPGSVPADLAEFLHSRFGEGDRAVHGLGTGAPVSIQAEPKQTLHVTAPPFSAETALAAVVLRLNLPATTPGCPLRLAVQDPLNPRQELMCVDTSIAGPGLVEVVLDIPDQVIPPGRSLWLSLTFGARTTVADARLGLVRTTRAVAVEEALAFRKLHLKGLFCILSEARPWNRFSKRANFDLEAWYKTDHWGRGVKELAETIAQCKELGPDDETVRCYDEWFWRQRRDSPAPEPRIDAVPGAPEWAVLLRQAWLTARRVPEWWLDHRLVPTGEFGGLVGDDTDMFQNYADFPMLEVDGVAARIKTGAAALAELAETENLESGLNKRTMDPLHAYEEGINHEALMLWWFYGDPVYFERCMLAAKSMPALTVVTAKGHRHFKNQDCGAQDLRIDRELGIDGHAHPLMLHPCFELAWYNRNPAVLQFLREWADGWLEHLEPDAYATSIDVNTEKVTAAGRRPLYGGYGGQASAHGFLYWLTDDRVYMRPFMDLFAKGEARWPSPRFVPELWQRGVLDELTKSEDVLAAHPVTRAIALGQKAALYEALRADIAELQRFRIMYTEAEVFTDRVFLNAITNAAICYTGGYATRNKYNHTHAVSWEGFGTDYAALVLRARRDHFKTLLYNFRDTPASGTARFWTLAHGEYQLTFGADRDGDEQMDDPARSATVTVGRASTVDVVLPPQTTVVLELRQTKRLDDITSRPDLAICARELAATADGVKGVVHNIGAKACPAFNVALIDAAGTTRADVQLGPLEAPLDLEPKVATFRFNNVSGLQPGWQVAVDPDDQVQEIFEGNNRCEVAVDVATH